MTERTIDLIDKYCGKCEFAKDDLDAEPCRSCIEDYNNGVTPPFFRVKKSEPKTNYDRIRNMSVEEMANFLVNVLNAYAMECMYGVSECKNHDIDNGCSLCFKEWLETEVSENDL